MPKRDNYEHGVPSWVDLASTDEEAAKAFYHDLFGWEWEGNPMPTGGTYWMATLSGEYVAGLTGQTQEMQDNGVPSTWYTYVAVDSVDEVTERARASGASVIAEPLEVGELGRMAFIADPSGAPIGFWEAGAHKGAGLVSEAGAMIWNEIYAPDTTATVSFYGDLFGWKTGTMTMPDGSEYTTFENNGTTIGGTAPPASEEMPPQWQVWFGSDDVDATASKVRELGGTVLVGPTAFPGGKYAFFEDPTGAAFSVITPQQE